MAAPDQVLAVVLQLTSPAFKAGAAIPPEFTCSGKDVSPPLAWTGAPKGTKSFALIMDDPDAPPGTWVHWVLYDIPGQISGLEKGLAKKEELPSGAKQGLCWGVNDFDRTGYWGPCPPPGKPHHYSFRLYALDRKLGLPAKTTKEELRRAMEGHILAQAELVGVFGR